MHNRLTIIGGRRVGKRRIAEHMIKLHMLKMKAGEKITIIKPAGDVTTITRDADTPVPAIEKKDDTNET